MSLDFSLMGLISSHLFLNFATETRGGHATAFAGETGNRKN